MSDAISMSNPQGEIQIDLEHVIGFRRDGEKYTIYTTGGAIALDKDWGKTIVEQWVKRTKGER